MQHYSEKQVELRIVRSKHTGGVDPNEILKLIDQDTVLFSACGHLTLVVQFLI